MLESGKTQTADGASNRKYVTSTGSGSFAPANGGEAVYYPEGGRGADFIAYYPYSADMEGFSYPVDVGNQSNQAEIDLMTAGRVSAQGGTPVNLAFKHRLARLELEIKPGPGLTGAALKGLRVNITGQRVKGGFDINANTLSPEGAAGQSIPLKVSEDGKFAEGIILPADAAEGRQLLFTLGSAELSYTIPAGHEFKPGTGYKYRVTLSSSPSAEREIIEGWDEGPAGPEPSQRDKIITAGYDRGAAALIDGAGNPAGPVITLSKAQNASVTLKSGGEFQGVAWYLDGKGVPGQTFTLKAAEAGIKTYSITFTGWRGGSYLCSGIILCTVIP
jgi:hypothetical protein